jgi:hypothetical protein
MGLQMDPARLFDIVARQDGPKSHYEERAIEKLLSFRLYAFILHDPEQHRRLDRRLSRGWDRLSEQTGQELLFTSIATPAPRARTRRRNGDCAFAFPFDVMAEEDRRTWSNLSPPAFGARLLAARLGLDALHLPCIVVTDSLREPRVTQALPTSSDAVDDQLYMLTTLARSGDLDPGDLKAVAALVDEPGETIVELPRSLAECLAQAFAAIPMPAADPRASRMHRDELLRFLSERLQRARDSRPATPVDHADARRPDAVEDLLLALAEAQQDPHALAVVPDGQQIATHPNFEPASRRWLQQSEALWRPVEEGTLTPDILAIGVAKTFEHEVNRSIVQRCRQQLGVAMPGRFAEWCEQSGQCAVETGGRHPVELNGRRNKEWLPPTIGAARHAASALIDAGMEPPRDWALLRGRWDEITRLRNTCCHAHDFSREHLDELLSLHRALVDDGVYPELFDLRRRLSRSSPA